MIRRLLSQPTALISGPLNSTILPLIVIFADNKSKPTATPPLLLPGITRRGALKTLGVTTTNGLSMAGHIRGVITSCSHTLHALRVRAVVIAKLCYASSAWWGSSTSGDTRRNHAAYAKAIALRTLPTPQTLYTVSQKLDRF